MIFIVYAAVLAPLVSATIGSLSLCLGDPGEWKSFLWIWLRWWMGDGFGALIVAPFLLSWSSSRKIDGTVLAANREDGSGAILTVRLPATVGPRIFAEQRG